MNRDALIRKIKACLRLAGSSNPNEAATALRQAQALMEAHGIDPAEVNDVAEATSKLRGLRTPPQSLVALAVMCGDAFGASTVIVYVDFSHSGVRFYGVGGSAEIAAYAFTVLRRQMDRDRRRHIARVRKRANREARGEAFARAWVYGVRALLPEIKVPDAAQKAIAETIALRHPHVGSTSGRDLVAKRRVTETDYAAGHSAGRNAHLRTGVGGSTPRQLTHIA